MIALRIWFYLEGMLIFDFSVYKHHGKNRRTYFQGQLHFQKQSFELLVYR